MFERFTAGLEIVLIHEGVSKQGELSSPWDHWILCRDAGAGTRMESPHEASPVARGQGGG